jgi:hypothetical protein
VTQAQATEIQAGRLSAKDLLKGILTDDLDAFCDEIELRTNKFEAHSNFAKE